MRAANQAVAKLSQKDILMLKTIKAVVPPSTIGGHISAEVTVSVSQMNNTPRHRVAIAVHSRKRSQSCYLTRDQLAEFRLALAEAEIEVIRQEANDAAQAAKRAAAQAQAAQTASTKALATLPPLPPAKVNA
jgi:hypothetical protein